MTHTRRVGVYSRDTAGCWLTGEEKPELSSHVLRDALQHQLLGLLRAVHAHALAVLRQVVLPCLLLQELLSLTKERKINNTTFNNFTEVVVVDLIVVRFS